MSVAERHRAIVYRADARYRALMDHCLGCTACRANTTTECPEATALRRAWQLARGGETA